MSSLMDEVVGRAEDLGVPLSVQIDLTWRCNERCEHCYLDHDDLGEMTTAEVLGILDQLAAAGTLFLIFSGGEILLRHDLFPIIEYARRLMFSVKLKTNALLIGEKEARRIRELGVAEVQISIYSHRPEVHDGITKVRGSLERSIRAIRFLKSQGIKVIVANVLMRQNMFDYKGVQALAAELGVTFTIDPTITPKIDGDMSLLDMRIPAAQLQQVFREPSLVGNVAEFCAPPAAAGDDVMEGYSCSAGHTSCYVSPYADVFPCVQFPLPTGNLRRERFLDVWRGSEAMDEVRSIRVKDLPTCSGCGHAGSCTRCPGLAYMEGNMRGPSSADCEKSFVRTGIVTAGMREKAAAGLQEKVARQSTPAPLLIQIQGLGAQKVFATN